MTELRYLPDEDGRTTFTATVTDATDDGIVLDGTYFYPEGGGQPPDHGTLAWDGGTAQIDHVRKDHGEVVHEIASLEGALPARGTAVEGQIDSDRRDRLSRMHTAQHVISRVVLDEYGGSTAGNQVHEAQSRIDFEPVQFDQAAVSRIESLSNDLIARDLPVHKEYRDREAVERTVDEGRALLDLIPESVDPLRVVDIGEVDMCPCGGTHVDRLGAVGEIEILDRTSKGAQTERLTFTLHA